MNEPEKRRWWARALVGVGGVGVATGIAAFVVISAHIGSGVRAASDSAMQHYPGDAVEALIGCVEDRTQTLQERNNAVWALGQLGDRRALPALRTLRTAQPCNHAWELCQHELDKAIALMNGGVNATAWIWRERASK